MRRGFLAIAAVGVTLLLVGSAGAHTALAGGGAPGRKPSSVQRVPPVRTLETDLQALHTLKAVQLSFKSHLVVPVVHHTWRSEMARIELLHIPPRQRELLLKRVMLFQRGRYAKAIIPTRVYDSLDKEIKTAVKKYGKTYHQKPLPVRLKVSVGFFSQFQDGTLVPVRVSARNKTSRTLSGIIGIPDALSAFTGSTTRALYQQDLTLGPGETKNLTLYLPAGDVNGNVHVEFLVSGRVDGSDVTFGSPFQPNAVVIGDLTNNPASLVWVRSIKFPGGRWLTVVPLTPTTFDSAPQALQNFDDIVIGDGTIASLDSAQRSALVQYVQDGGGLIAVGGPGWQQSIDSLPPSLRPGHISATRTISSLGGLAALTPASTSGLHGQTEVSVLSHPRGTVEATQNGIPLIVDTTVGQGRVVYLGFDPTLNPVASWGGMGTLMASIAGLADPQAVARPGNPNNMAFPVYFSRWYYSSEGGGNTITGELDNLASPALGYSIGFLLLAGLFVLLLGPIMFVVTGKLRRRSVAWIGIPLGALLCTASTFGVAAATRDQSVLLNEMTVVSLNGSSSTQTANVYAGLFAPVAGNYSININQPAYPQTVPNSNYYPFGPGGITSDLNPSNWNKSAGIRFEEGAQTKIDFSHMATWTMRNAEIATSVHVSGRIKSQLHIDSSGDIVGRVTNATDLRYVHPSLIAGRNWISLPTLNPGQTVSVKVRPHFDIFDRQWAGQPIWEHMYGRIRLDYASNSLPFCFGSFGNCGNGLPGAFQGDGPPIVPITVPNITVSSTVTSFGGHGPRVNPGGCFGCGCYGYGCCYNCYGSSSYPREHSYLARLRNVADLLPEAQVAAGLGEILFAGWNTTPLVAATVNGGTPTTRVLNLVVQPLQPASIASGKFRIRTGTITPQLESVDPAAANQYYDQVNTGIDIGYGGSATVQFQLPNGNRLHFNRLKLYVDAGGSDSINMGHVWDWSAHKYVVFDLYAGYVTLTKPNRFVSPQGVIRVKLVNNDTSRNLAIALASQNIQIQGKGVALPVRSR